MITSKQTIVDLKSANDIIDRRVYEMAAGMTFEEGISPDNVQSELKTLREMRQKMDLLINGCGLA